MEGGSLRHFVEEVFCRCWANVRDVFTHMAQGFLSVNSAALAWPAHVSEIDIGPLILCLRSLSLETLLPSHDGSHDWIFRMSPDCPERDVWP